MLPFSRRTIYNRPMSRISDLYRLQELDLALDRGKARIAEIQSILEDNRELQAARKAVENAEEVYKKSHASNTSAEQAVAAQREKIAQSEKALYGGTVTNPKELQDLQREVESLKRYLATLEDRLLEAMVQLEDAQTALDDSQQALAALEQSQAEAHKALIAERKELEKTLERHEVEREAALKGISEEDFELYTRLRDRLSGLAVARVVDNTCSACGLEIARSRQQAIRMANEIVRCGQCGRILYSG